MINDQIMQLRRKGTAVKSHATVCQLYNILFIKRCIKVLKNFCFRRIILNNPKKRNALSLAMLSSLWENIVTGVDSDDLRVIIISGRESVNFGT